MAITIEHTTLPGVVIINPRVFQDDRGFFYESFNDSEFAAATNTNLTFVQDNHSFSKSKILRGLHYQIKQPQGKLVRVIAGSVFDVAVDIRKSSSNFGKWFGVELSAHNKKQLWVPPGFAHGFVVLSDYAEFLYKTTDYYNPKYERSIIWNDRDIAIEWPILDPVLNQKDSEALTLRHAELFD